MAPLEPSLLTTNPSPISGEGQLVGLTARMIAGNFGRGTSTHTGRCASSIPCRAFRKPLATGTRSTGTRVTHGTVRGTSWRAGSTSGEIWLNLFDTDRGSGVQFSSRQHWVKGDARLIRVLRQTRAVLLALLIIEFPRDGGAKNLRCVIPSVQRLTTHRSRYGSLRCQAIAAIAPQGGIASSTPARTNAIPLQRLADRRIGGWRSHR
jgi:hypothetical protein